MDEKYKGNLKFILVVVIALLLRLVNLNQSFWLDEAAQVIESSRPFLQQFDLTADFHPPLYHILLHFWLIGGKSEIWVRLLSIGFGIGTIIILFRIGELLVNKKAALIAALFLAISPYHIWYSQEARPYMAFLFFSLVSTFFLLRKKWFWYTIFAIFTIYTNYFAIFLLVGQMTYVFVFEKKYVKTWLISLGIILSSFVFWIPELLKQLEVGTNGLFTGWTSVVSVSQVRAVALTFAKFIFGHGTFANKYLYALIIIPVFLLFIVSLGNIRNFKTGKILIILFLVPFIISEFISFFIPIIAPQRLIFLLPIFYLILSYGISNLSTKIQSVFILVVIITSLGGVYQYYVDPNVQREKWREAVSFTESGVNSESAALFVFPGPFAPFTWYTKGQIDAWGIAPNFIVTDNDLNNLSVKLAAKNKLFLYQYLTGLTDPQGKTQNYLSSSGFKQTDIRNFPGVGFIYIYER